MNTKKGFNFYHKLRSFVMWFKGSFNVVIVWKDIKRGNYKEECDWKEC